MSTPVWRPEIPDRAGRGAHCSRIHQITKDIELAQEHGDEDEVKRLLKRLDKERAAFHKLYEHTPKPVEVAHAEVIE